MAVRVPRQRHRGQTTTPNVTYTACVNPVCPRRLMAVAEHLAICPRCGEPLQIRGGGGRR